MLPERIMDQMLAFRREREWEQFHTPKNLAIAIAVEAAELLEQFQWTPDSERAETVAERMPRIRDEIADVAILLSYLAHDLGIDIDAAVSAKLTSNAERYPANRSRGKAVKYDRL